MLKISNICKTYNPKKGVPVKALDNVSLDIEEKGLVFILGKSGSGKSTLLNVLGGLDKYDSGDIEICGKSSKDFSQSDFDSYRNTFIGFIFQEYNILDEFTVGANIALAMELQGKKATNEALNKILDEVDLTGYANRKPNELSGGQKQRVAIARALIKDPEIIMADEPTGALDSNTGKQVFDTLKKLSKEKLVIVVSHDRDFAEQYGDRVIEFADGKIISDIKKYIAPSKSESEGVSVIDDKILHIKKGYTLTAKDLDLINKYLSQNSNDDKFISIDGKTNEEIRKFARIDDNGNKESFKATEPEDIVLKNYEKNEFKLIKSRLPYKNSLKIGASSLKNKPFRLFITILLSAIAFAMFGLANTMSSYNKYDATYTSINDANINYLTYSKGEKYDENFDYYNNILMTNDDIATLNKVYDGADFIPVYTQNNYGSYSFSDSLYDTTKLPSNYGSFYTKNFSGFASITAEQIASFGYELICGTLPQNDNEIVIPQYVYEHFEKAGYKNQTNAEDLITNVTSPTQLLGKSIIMYVGSSNPTFKIVGVIDTKFDSSRYNSYKEDQDEANMNQGIGDFLLINEMQVILNKSLHSVGFITSQALDSLINPTTESQGGIKANDDGGAYNVNFMAANTYPYTEYLFKASETNDKIVYKSGKTSVGDKEIVVPIDWLPNIFSDFVTSYDNYIESEFINYATANVAAAITRGFDYTTYNYDITGTETEQQTRAYKQYLQTDGFVSNSYGDSTGKELVIQLIEDFIKAIDYDNDLMYVDTSVYINKAKYNDSINPTIRYSIIGVTYSLPEFYYFHDYNLYNLRSTGAVLSDDFFNQFIGLKSGYYSFAVAKMPSGDSLKKAISFYYDGIGNDTCYKIENAVTYMLEQVNSFIEGAAKIFLYIGIGFAIFASLMLFNFITTSISYKKREIGILRAVGARGTDVLGIFFNESLIIALINFAIATILCIIGISALNNYFKDSFKLMITILNFGIVQILLMLVIAVAVAFISSALPVYGISRKKPIDAIRNH